MKRKQIVLWALLLCLLSVQILSAQSPSGLGRAPFGSYADMGLDTINLYSGNLMLHMPLFSLPGREGLSTGMSLTYNSGKWYGIGYQGIYGGGWSLANPMGALTMYAYLDSCTSDPFYVPPTGTFKVYVEWEDPTGATHVFNNTGTEISVGPEDGGCEGFTWERWENQVGGVWLYSLNDFDGLMAYVDGEYDVKIAFPDGKAIIGDKIQTRNGNYIQPNVTPWTDNLGRTIGITSGSNGSGTHYLKYSLEDANGDPQEYQINYTDCKAAYNPIEATSDCILNVIESINLPNGRSYSFVYAHNQGFLTKIVLPTGGYIEFDYYGGNSDTDATHNYIVGRRVSADGSTTTPWTTYERTPSGSDRIITVTAPEVNGVNHQVVHTFDSTGFEKETAWLEDVMASPTKVVVTTRGGLGQLDTVTTQIGDLKQRQTYTWDWFRPSTVTQSDWYPAAGSVVPLARTITAYVSCADPCNLIFPAAVTLQEWDGMDYVSQGMTTYTYGNTVTSTSGVPNHESPLYARLNVTAVRSYKDDTNYDEETFTYDATGNPLTHVDARGKTTTFSYTDDYDDVGNQNSKAYPTLVTNAEGHTVATVYNFATGLPVSVTDPRGIETTYAYDEMNRPETITVVTSPTNRVTTMTYDDATPKVTEQVSVASDVYFKTETTMDKLGRTTQVKRFDPAGDVFVDTEYEASGQVKRVSTPYRSSPSAWTQSISDVLGRPLTVTNPDTTTVTLSYDDNAVTTTDEAGNSRRQTFNALGHLLKVEEPDPASSGYLETEYTYYISGALKKVIQGSLSDREYTRNWLGWLEEETHPETGTTGYTYYAGGLPHTRTDARNLTTTYVYDNIGRLLDVEYAASDDVHYRYDQNGFTGLLTLAQVDGVMQSTFTYNPVGQLATETVYLSGVTGTHTTAYEYDLGGRLTEMTYPSGRVVKQSYTVSGSVAGTLTDELEDDTTGTILLQSVQANPAGAITSRTLGDGGNSINETRTFNSRNQLTHITAAANSSTLVDMGYGYGTYNDGRIRTRTDTVQPEHSAAYTFDEIGRLTAVDGGNSSWGISWTLDRYGNRLTQTPSGLASGRVGQPSTAYYNNKIAASSQQYDAAGNMTYDGSHHYSYDAENRIVQINSSSTQYAYDYAGRRVRKVNGGVTTFYFYGLTGLTSEFSTDDNDNDAVVAAADDRLEYRVGEQTGTAVMLLDSGGVPRENNRVFPFGEPWLAFAGSSNKEKFTTYQHDNDDATDLDYAMARYYASRSGRFMTPDPGHVGASVGDPQSWNAYVYVGNDPINGVDPLGLYVQRVYDASICQLGKGTLIAEYIGTIRSMGPDGVITFDTSTTGYDCDFPDDVQTQGGTGPPHLGNLAQASANAYANLRDIRDRLSMGTINSFRCYSFLYRGGLSPITLINAILAYNTLGQGTIRQQPGVPSPGIGASTGNAQYAIVLNTEGGYFARRAGVNPPGGYGTLAEAQKYVMVHEVGHLTGAIAVDTRLATQAANDAAQRLNDRDINANCGGFIRGLP